MRAPVSPERGLGGRPRRPPGGPAGGLEGAEGAGPGPRLGRASVAEF